ncbi:MAG: MMPL family transporter [Candidatus Thiodiazotropha sp. (ex Lucinoma annulata)]|nr:MMPL family transporter [Candidatus Thiodiazotropha sp. (ex Lucinoma annulata)]
MRCIINLAARYPWLVIMLLGLITVTALIRLPDLQVEITAEGMMVRNPDALALYENTMQTFGSEKVTVVYLEDENLFDPDNLAAIHQALVHIQSIPQIHRAVSLFSIRYLRTVDGYIYSDPYLKTIPKSRQSATSLANTALLNPLVERNLLSSDGTVMAINLYFDPADYQRGFDEQVATALDHAIAPLKQRLRHVFHLGDPSIRSGISEQIRADQKIILPIALLVLVVTLGMLLRRLNATLIPLFTASLSVVWILGVMATLGIPVNVMTSIVPALLIIVGSTEDIHLISEYQTANRKGVRGLLANRFMANHMGTAVLLTFVTTCLGFLSISLNQIDLLQQFGLVTAIGLTLNFIITITLVPACLQLFTHQTDTQSPLGGSNFVRFSSSTFNVVFRFPRSVTIAVLLFMGLSCYWAMQIKVNNNVLDYFEASSELPYQAKLIQRKLSGIQSLAIVVSGNKDAFLKIHQLEQLQILQDYLEQTGLYDKSFSFADFIGVVHSGIDGEHPNKIYLPDNDEVISEYMSLLGHANARSFVSPDFSSAKIIVRHGIDSSSLLNQAVQDIMQFSRESIDPQLEVVVTGGSYLNSQAVDYMADGQTRSLLLMLTVIFLLVTLLLMNTKIGLVAVIANLFPILVLFGVMGYFEIALDTGTAMVAAIALGICVDHTMHFMVRYQRLINEGLLQMEALAQVIQQESRPIFVTAIALAMGFATLTFSNFPPVALFGMLSALVMLLALIGTFVVTPLMLYNFTIKNKLPIFPTEKIDNTSLKDIRQCRTRYPLAH